MPRDAATGHRSPARAALRIGLVGALVLVAAGIAYWRLQADPGSVAIASGGIAQAAAVSLPPDIEPSPSIEPTPNIEPTPPKPSATWPSRSGVVTDAAAAYQQVPDGTGTKPDSDDEAGFVPTPVSDEDSASLGQLFTWNDGDRERRVWIDNEHVVPKGADSPPLGDGVADTPRGAIVRKEEAGGSSASNGEPVFRSESGELMTLPGGVILVFESGMDSTAIDAFFTSHAIDSAAVEELDYLPNAYFIETPAGLASLTLANRLAGQDGVELSSPNWWVERVPK